MERDYRPIDNRCFELVNHYKLWITKVGKNKKPSLFVCRPNDYVYENVGLLSNPDLFVAMLRGDTECEEP